MKKTQQPAGKAPRLKIKKGDIVRVIAGSDIRPTSEERSQGAPAKKEVTGRVLEVHPKTMRIVVEGVNVRKKHMRPTQEFPEGTIAEKEMPIHYSNVQLVSDSK
jgi:large subunit ribosomal protein L24